jgi:hypothetical protein
MENAAPVVGPDVPTADSKMVKPDIAIAEFGVGRLIHEAGLQFSANFWRRKL